MSKLRLLQVIAFLLIIVGLGVGASSDNYTLFVVSLLATIVIRLARWIWRD